MNNIDIDLKVSNGNPDEYIRIIKKDSIWYLEDNKVTKEVKSEKGISEIISILNGIYTRRLNKSIEKEDYEDASCVKKLLDKINQ